MTLLSPGLLWRADGRFLNLPQYISFLCILVGVAWLLLLPLNDYSRNTYISENALLPGQVHTYFAGSDQNIFRGFKQEVDSLVDASNTEINNKLEGFFLAAGLKTARQNFEYTSAGNRHVGENLYAILHAPRGDATEAVVLVGAWRNMEEELNQSGIALVLTLARYFKRWSLWSKDIIFLITPDSRAGPQAWVDAYHDALSSPGIDALPLKGGALQGALAIDYPFDHRFESLHIVYDGVNGQLPNLDLFNTITAIASGQMGIGVSLQQMWAHTDNYHNRLQTMLRGMLRQGLGHASGPHSCFIPYHIDAVTLQPFGDGWQDEMAMGRVIESTFRSLNNLLEHLHQSFFFYLLMQSKRFVSIGTYLPSAMLVAVNFTIMAISLWVQSGRAINKTPQKTLATVEAKLIGPNGDKDHAPYHVEERHLLLPMVVVGISQFLGVIPMYLFNNSNEEMLLYVFGAFSVVNIAFPVVISKAITYYFMPTNQQYQLMKSFSLLLLGMFLSSLATLNFSLALLVGLLASPLTFVTPLPKMPLLAAAAEIIINLLAPTVVLYIGSSYWEVTIKQVLTEAAFGWDVWRMSTQFVVWYVWWPAWLVGAIVVLGKPREEV